MLHWDPATGRCPRPVVLEDRVEPLHVLRSADQGGPARPVDAGPGGGTDLGHGPPELQGASGGNVQPGPTELVDEAD